MRIKISDDKIAKVYESDGKHLLRLAMNLRSYKFGSVVAEEMRKDIIGDVEQLSGEISIELREWNLASAGRVGMLEDENRELRTKIAELENTARTSRGWNEDPTGWNEPSSNEQE